MREIFSLQWELNVHTLANTGKDFEATMNDPEQKVVWIENYRKALSAELAELIREVRDQGLSTQNGKVEIVDILHFLVSLSQIVGLNPEEVPSFGPGANGDSFDSCAILAFLALDDLQGSLKWKWWAKGGGFKPEKAKRAVGDLWEVLFRICAVFGLDFQELKKIYVAKNRINFERQRKNYNEDTKTEDDNRTIEI
ncbi:MAG: dUTP diphosphatase [Syntrophobacteraceae bacterium]|nr:dUTP diphosphatase [Syntrophobacteraceae bacterium]